MQPTDIFVDAGTLRVHVRDWGGPTAATPPIVLVHGLASNARIWDLVAPILAREFRTVAIDQRGHGRSDKPDHGYDFASVTNDLIGVIGALGFVRPLIVGHSWGANVALQLAADAPELPSGIVLVDGGTTEVAAGMSLEQTLERLAPPRLAGTPRATFIDNLRNRWMGALWSPEVETIILENFAVDAEDRIAPHLTFENHLRVVHAMWEQRPTQLFARITCPTLIIPADPPLPLDERAAQWLDAKRSSVALAETQIANVRVVWARESVHDVPLQHPAFLAEQIASLASTSRET
jgi:pimeloyl-ACP methyl ester carboxylesterase